MVPDQDGDGMGSGEDEHGADSIISPQPRAELSSRHWAVPAYAEHTKTRPVAVRGLLSEVKTINTLSLIWRIRAV